ncbi:MAG: hypothetical protein IKW01_01180 [Firmicutes bacterium]|nr:hypothetical protein [Bacillota bacterium]
MAGGQNGKQAAKDAAIEQAKEELKNYPNIPEHYDTISKAPNLKMEGIFSEIDLDIARRLKRCDIFAKRRNILELAHYKYVRKTIEEGTKNGLRQELARISRKHRLLTRAARICKDKDAKLELLKEAEALKKEPAVKSFNLLIDGLEVYAGASADKTLSYDSILAFEKELGYMTYGGPSHRGMSAGFRQRPEKITIKMENMDDVLEKYKVSHPGAKRKSPEQLEKVKPTYEMFSRVAPVFAQDACKDALECHVGSISDNLDLIIVGGKTLRECIKEKDNLEELSKEQIDDIGCNYVAAALKNGNRVEAFVPLDHLSGSKIYYSEPVTITCSSPKERVTLNLWEKWMSVFGFYKDKVKLVEQQMAEDKAMEECRNKVRAMAAENAKLEFKGKKPPFVFRPNREEQAAKADKLSREVLKDNKEKFIDDYIEEVRHYEISNAERVKLKHSFFPDEVSNFKLENDNQLRSLARDMPLYYSIYLMGKEGIPYEEILDVRNFPHEEKRKEIGKKLKDSFKTMTGEEFDKMHLECMEYFAEQIKPFAEKMSEKIHDHKTLMENYTMLRLGTLGIKVSAMDDFSVDSKIVREKYGAEKFDKLVKTLHGAGTSVYSLNKLHDLNLQRYHALLTGDPLNLNDMAELKIHEAAVLKGLKNKELGVNIDDFNIISTKMMMSENPEFKKLETKIENGDVKVLTDLVVGGGKNTIKVDLQVSSGKTKTVEDIIINGKNSFELEGPELEKGR